MCAFFGAAPAFWNSRFLPYPLVSDGHDFVGCHKALNTWIFSWALGKTYQVNDWKCWTRWTNFLPAVVTACILQPKHNLLQRLKWWVSITKSIIDQVCIMLHSPWFHGMPSCKESIELMSLFLWSPCEISLDTKFFSTVLWNYIE